MGRQASGWCSSPPTGPFPSDALTVSAVELRRNFGVWQERAFAQPVVVVRHGKPRLVLSSAERFLNSSGQADAALQSAVAAIPEHSSEAFLVLDRDLRLLAANHVFEDMAGRQAARMVGRTWSELFPAQAESIVTGHFRHVLLTGASLRFDMPSALLEGRHYEFSVFPHSGGIAALVVNRTAEQAMRRELEDCRSLAAAVAMVPHAGQIKINLRGAIYAASPQLRAITGLDPDASPHVPFTDALHPDERPRMSEVLDAALSAGRSARLPTALLTAAGDAAPIDLVLTTVWRGAAADGALALFTVIGAATS
ncbi:MAG: PAS domain-containing protein [Phenylobacterium sp.]|nr:MAG: PAS domain-containing protein [Phenylobacterium sp.]